MKSDHYLIAGAVISLIWSIRTEAHDSLQAISQGGNIVQLTAAALHPLWEIPYVLPLLVTTLVSSLWFVSRYRASRKNQSSQSASLSSQLVAVRHDSSSAH